MKILNLKNVMSVLTCLALTLAVAAPSVAYAGDKGQHKGWSKYYKGKGEHKGWDTFHEKQNGSEPSGGEEWTVQVWDFALERGLLMSVTVNSLITVQDLMDTVAGGSGAPDYVELRDCLPNMCEATDTDGPLNPSLTLEASSVVNGELLYLLLK